MGFFWSSLRRTSACGLTANRQGVSFVTLNYCVFWCVHLTAAVCRGSSTTKAEQCLWCEEIKMDSGEAEAVSCCWTKLSMTDQQSGAVVFTQCGEMTRSRHTLFSFFIFVFSKLKRAMWEIGGNLGRGASINGNIAIRKGQTPFKETKYCVRNVLLWNKRIRQIPHH